MPSVPIDRRGLPNGLRVILSHDDSAPVVAVNLWYDVGSKHEKPGQTGFAHLFEHMMFQGSEHVAEGRALQPACRLRAARSTAPPGFDRTNYFETLPSHQLELALWLESDRMGSLLAGHDPGEARQPARRGQERAALAHRQPAVRHLGREAPDAHLPEGHPYHHSVSARWRTSPQRPWTTSASSSRPLRPNNAVLTIAGDFDPDLAMEMVERHFGPIPANENLPPQPDMELQPFLLGKEVRQVVPDQVPLPRVYLAYRIPTYGSDPFDALEVGADVLGTGRASRLYANLIRKNQLAQDVAVFPFPLAGGASMLAIWATARPGVSADRLEAALSEEVARLLEAGPSEDELARVRNLHDASVGASLEQVSERADRLSMYTTLFDEPERINDEMSRYDAVSSDRVQEAYASFVRPDNQVVVTYVPAESAEEAA